jgi:hypothetical protein
MKALIRSIVLTLGVLLTLSVALAVIIKDRPTAFSNGSDIILHWSTTDESGVQKFEVCRRTGTMGDFLTLGSVDKKGDNSSYEYVDRSVFKAESHIYQYKIRIINAQSPVLETETISVSHLSSTAKSTWGSIKAMFR